MEIFFPRMVIQSFSALYFARSFPSNRMEPPVTEPLASSIPRKDLVNTDLPEPDSPTMASVSPWYKSREHLRIAFNFLPRRLKEISTSLADKIGSLSIFAMNISSVLYMISWICRI